LLGYCALAAGIRLKDNNLAIPALFSQFFPDWFAGVAFAAIVIGALVPAAIMSIGAANLFASNILQTFRARIERPAIETNVARYLALCVLAGAFCIAVFVKPQFSINFQLLGGAWILQIFPAVILGLYTRRLHPAALLIGWAAGIAAATWMVFGTGFAAVFPLQLGSSVIPGAIVFYSLLLNLAVTIALTWVFNLAKLEAGSDLTTAGDYA
jgi:SSS family solute:Na+ symporter